MDQERKNPIAAIAMTARYTFSISPRDAPELCMNLSPKEGVALP
jgi:hypothetical protein